MKRTLIAAAVLSLAFAVPAFAADSNPPPNPTGQTFEQRQADILKMIDERITSLQEGKTCVQAAKNEDDLKVCRQKHMAEMREKRGEMRPQRGMGGPMGPGGQGGPMGPGGPMNQ
jgi:hypothetical protein